MSQFEFLPGLDGIPFKHVKGEMIPPITDPERELEVKLAAHAKVFNLSDETDLKEYNEVIQRSTGVSTDISKEEMHWDDSKHSFIVFLRWVDRWLELKAE
jgi:hypothetical protein